MDYFMMSFRDPERKTPMKLEEGDDQEEEALSLCDFPLSSDEPAKDDFAEAPQELSKSSSSADFFEFFNDHNSENICMSHAEDIISGGELVPLYKRQPLILHDQILKFLSRDDDDINVLNSSRRYCESLPDRRSSRSIDSTKLRRSSSLLMTSGAAEVRRNFSKGSVRSDHGLKGSKPRWYALMFGLVRFPASPEMDLREMRSRQVRRSPGSMFGAVEGGGVAAAGRRSSWGDDLLNALSCKKHASVAVTMSSEIKIT